MKTCPKCNAQLQDDAQFCYACGTVLTDTNTAADPGTQNTAFQSADPSDDQPTVSYQTYQNHGGQAQGGQNYQNQGSQNYQNQGTPNYQSQGSQNYQSQGAKGFQSQGTPNFQSYQNYQGSPNFQQSAYTPADPYDHTSEFTAKDISDNKVIAMMPYIMGTLGIIVALLASSSSPYVAFHVRQALKLTVVNALITIATGLLSWTCIMLAVGPIAIIVLFVVRVICFFQVCSGKAKEPAIVKKLNFLR